MPNQGDSFRSEDAAMIGAIAALGGLGYLCDAHSPIVAPFLPIFGLFFLGAFLALGGICVVKLVSRMRATELLAALAVSVMAAGILFALVRWFCRGL